MNFWYIKHYAASFGDDFDTKMNKFKHQMDTIKLWCIKHYGARVGDDFVTKKITNLNVPNGYSKYS